MGKFLILIAVILLSGCVKDVQPWEKEQLSSDSMRSDGANALSKQFQEHVYFSKEGTRGGGGVSGGGCGCN
jgi:hypothetical protein